MRKKESMYIRANCVKCNVKKQCSKGVRNNKRTFRALCTSCYRERHNITTGKYSKHKKNKCEKCGFVPVNLCQLDVDHIDGNHKNNSVNNLQTLCSNCHRLKTYLFSDYAINK